MKTVLVTEVVGGQHSLHTAESMATEMLDCSRKRYCYFMQSWTIEEFARLVLWRALSTNHRK